jgi:cation transporter-like permease
MSFSQKTTNLWCPKLPKALPETTNALSETTYTLGSARLCSALHCSAQNANPQLQDGTINMVIGMAIGMVIGMVMGMVIGMVMDMGKSQA